MISIVLAAILSLSPADTVKVNTIQSGAKIIGYNDRTPVEISAVDGVITEIKALPNRESPGYFRMVLESGLLQKLNGLKVKDAKKVELDAVSGATYSSEAIIRNIEIGLEQLEH